MFLALGLKAVGACFPGLASCRSCAGVSGTETAKTPYRIYYISKGPCTKIVYTGTLGPKHILFGYMDPQGIHTSKFKDLLKLLARHREA